MQGINHEFLGTQTESIAQQLNHNLSCYFGSFCNAQRQMYAIAGDKLRIVFRYIDCNAQKIYNQLVISVHGNCIHVIGIQYCKALHKRVDLEIDEKVYVRFAETPLQVVENIIRRYEPFLTV